MIPSTPDPADIAIGELLTAATDPASQQVIRAYNHSATHKVNLSNLTTSTFKVPLLNACANFLGLATEDDDNKKLYANKKTLADRIIIKIESFLETQCDECDETYRTRHGEETLLKCFLCLQGSHDCTQMKSKCEMTPTSPILRGSVWLCHGCRAKNDLTQPPKKKDVTFKDDKTEEPAEKEEEDDDEEEEESPRRNRSSRTQDQPICPLYKKMLCPHGLTGKREIDGSACPNRHPPRCFRYCRFGTDPRHGCKKGNECRYFHPILCKHSVRRKVCTIMDCQFTHLKYTKRYDHTGNQPPRFTNNHFQDGSRYRRNGDDYPTLGNRPVPPRNRSDSVSSTSFITPFPRNNQQQKETNNTRPQMMMMMNNDTQSNTSKNDNSFLVKMLEDMKKSFTKELQDVRDQIPSLISNATSTWPNQSGQPHCHPISLPMTFPHNLLQQPLQMGNLPQQNPHAPYPLSTY